MSLNLEGPLEKIKRAKKQIEDLAAAISEFRERYTYKGLLNFDAEKGLYYQHIFIMEDPLPGYAAQTGEIFHDLRSALEHLACQLALANGSPDCEDRSITFPVFYDVSRKKGKAAYDGIVKNFSRSAQALIDVLQPYNRPRTADQVALALLHELNLQDKHRLPNLFHLLLWSGPIVAHDRFQNRELIATEPGSADGEPIVGGAGVFTLPADAIHLPTPAGPEVNVYAEFGPEVAIDKTGMTQVEPIVPFLKQLADFTERVIYLFG